MKRKNRPAAIPRPARKFTPVENKETERSDEWLDAIDPERTRYSAPDKVVVWVRWVTPDDAREWLEHVPDYQRNKQERFLKNFEADMRDGYWINGIPDVAFDRHGDLINSQHVLTSLIASGLPKILCKVSINRWPDAYLGYDLGKARSLTDNLKGQTDSPGAAGRALSVLRLWDRGIFEGKDGKGYVNAREGSVNLSGRRGRELLAATPGLELHLFPNPFRGSKGTRSLAAMHVFSYRAYQTDPDNHPKFMEQFRFGVGLSKGDPVLALRNRFTSMEDNTRWRSGPTLAHILTAWNLFVSREKCTFLPFRMGNPFPKMAIPLPALKSPRRTPPIVQ